MTKKTKLFERDLEKDICVLSNGKVFTQKIIKMVDNENTIDYFGNKYNDECDCITPNGNFPLQEWSRT